MTAIPSDEERPPHPMQLETETPYQFIKSGGKSLGRRVGAMWRGIIEAIPKDPPETRYRFGGRRGPA